MRHQYIVRQVFVIISILSFLWLFQKVTEALDFGEEVLDDVNMKAKMEERQIHKDEIFVKGSPDVEENENEDIEETKKPEKKKMTMNMPKGFRGWLNGLQGRLEKSEVS